MEKLEMESAGDENSDVSELVKTMTIPSLTVLNAMPVVANRGGGSGPKSPPITSTVSPIEQNTDTPLTASKPESTNKAKAAECTLAEVVDTKQNACDTQATGSETVQATENSDKKIDSVESISDLTRKQSSGECAPSADTAAVEDVDAKQTENATDSKT